MNPPRELHPTLAELQAFDSGGLEPAERGCIERHLEGCPACCQTLDALPEGALEALVRAYGSRIEDPSFTTATDEGSSAAEDIPTELIGHPRYRVLGVLGAGGMGVVYKAIHRFMERVVALKVLNHALTVRPGFAERFRREVKAAARLAHPNIVTAYDADEAGAMHFLVMEYVAGTTLDREVARRGPLPLREACDLIHQAALGLQHAHERGLVHCDIKPHNLLLTPTGQVKILDFGLARVLDEGASETMSLPSGTLLGTPDYVAPEQARDPRCADIRADIYSLGCTLYHLLAGRPPFPTGTPLQKLLAHHECSPPVIETVHGDVPEALTGILERMLAKDPARRYSTPAELAADLASLADPASTAPAPAKPRPSRRALRRVAGALATLAALVLAVLVWSRSQGPEVGRPSEPPSGTPGEPMSLARQQRQVRDQAVDWLREHCLPPFKESLSGDVATHVDRDLEGSEAFGVLLGSGLVKSSKAVLMVGRAGMLHVFELSPALARGVPAGSCRVQNYSTLSDPRRAAPRVRLADLTVAGADRLFPERPVTGSVAYRIVERWPGEYALRLLFYFGKHRRSVFLPRAPLPEADHGTLRFSFPVLGNPDEVFPGPDAVFVEVVSQDSGRTVVESNAAAAAVYVMPAGEARTGKP
jgi:serine/threonine protein kinase